MNRRSHWVRSLLPAAVALGLVLAVGVGLWAKGDSSRSADLRSASASDLQPRSYPATAWTRAGLLVWGGWSTDLNAGAVRILDDGAIVDPVTGKGDDIVAVPPGTPALYAPVAVAAGDTAVLIGRECTLERPWTSDAEPTCRENVLTGLAYETSKRSWREFGIPKELRTSPPPVLAVVGTTREGIAVISGVRGQEPTAYWSVNLGTGAWRSVPTITGVPAGACVSDSRLVVLTTSFSNQGRIAADDPSLHLQPGGPVATLGPEDGFVEPVVSTLDLVDPASSWRSSAPVQDVKYSVGKPRVFCTKNSALVADTFGSRQLRLVTLSDFNIAIPPPNPVDAYYRDVVSTGTSLLFFRTEADAPSPERGADGIMFTPESGTWTNLPSPPARMQNALWSGTYVTGYGMAWTFRSENPPTDPLGVFLYRVPAIGIQG